MSEEGTTRKGREEDGQRKRKHTNMKSKLVKLSE
jgi:hypothetical protein